MRDGSLICACAVGLDRGLRLGVGDFFARRAGRRWSSLRLSDRNAERVDPQMFGEVVGAGESFLADFAEERLDAEVHALVSGQLVGAGESPRAVFPVAGERLLSRVATEVSLQVGRLVVDLLAVLVGAGVELDDGVALPATSVLIAAGADRASDADDAFRRDVGWQIFDVLSGDFALDFGPRDGGQCLGQQNGLRFLRWLDGRFAVPAPSRLRGLLVRCAGLGLGA